MKTYQIITALTLILALLGTASAEELPLSLDGVEIDDVSLTQDSVNRLALERDHDYELEVRFTPLEDIRDVEIRAFISGFEFSDVEEIEDTTPIFDADENVTYLRRLHIRLPDDVEEDDYKLRVIISDRFSDEFIANFNLKIDVPRHSLKVEDVVFSPSHTVKAGSALLATVRIENKGEQQQDDVKVTVRIPGLGIEGTQYIEEIEQHDEEEETEEIFIRIPRCAPAGNYDALIDVEFSQRRRKITEKETITVLEDETCQDDEDKSTITLGSHVQNVQGGQTTAFPVTVTNTGRNSQRFTITIQNNDWASVSITPTSMLVVPGGQTQTVFVNVQPHKDTPDGAHALTASIASGERVEQLTLTANVSGGKGATRALETILIVLVVLLVIIGIIIGIGSIRRKSHPETYY